MALSDVSRKTASICIATHRRPQGLARLLRSIGRQENAPPFEIIVVDNDRERSAEPTVTGFKDLPVTYLVEPVRGLASVRNRAVAAAAAPYLAFIDDDEEASSGWLAALDRVARRTGADVVIGPVARTFDSSVPDYIRTCSLFVSAPVADGTSLPWHAAGTANAYINRRSLPGMPGGPFLPRFDLTGGEDSDLFKRMADAGARIVASAEAGVTEHRPAARATLRWVVRRALRNGGTIVSATWQPTGVAGVLRRNAQAAMTGAREAAAATTRWHGSRRQAVNHLIRACEECGKIIHSVGFRVEEYRRHS